MMGPREAHAALEHLVARGRSSPNVAERTAALLDLCALHERVAGQTRLASAVRRGLLLVLAHAPAHQAQEPPLRPLLQTHLTEADLVGLPWQDGEEVLATAHVLTGLLPPAWLQRMVGEALRGFVRVRDRRAACHLMEQGSAFLPPGAIPVPGAARLVRHYTLFLLYLIVLTLLLPLLLVRAEGGRYAGPTIPRVGGGAAAPTSPAPVYHYPEGLYDVVITPLGPTVQTEEGRVVVWLATATKVGWVGVTARLLREVRLARRDGGIRLAAVAQGAPPP